MLEFIDVSFSYSPQRQALKDVSLSIAAGEFIGIAGRNGSGKTTLTRLMMSLIKPTSGRILLNGSDTKRAKPADMAKHIGYVFQNPERQMIGDTVAQEVAYGPKQLGFSPEKLQTAVSEALHVTGLTESSGVYPRLMSKGGKQRVAIASALAMKPDILILDEPTSGQDQRERNSLMQLLKTLNEAGKTILIVTHDMDILAEYTKRTIVLANGSKQFDGATANLFKKPDLAAWGLERPVAFQISAELASCGITLTSSVEDLCRQIHTNVRGGQR